MNDTVGQAVSEQGISGEGSGSEDAVNFQHNVMEILASMKKDLSSMDGRFARLEKKISKVEKSVNQLKDNEQKRETERFYERTVGRSGYVPHRGEQVTDTFAFVSSPWGEERDHRFKRKL